ncbi:hypothetical protein GUITHDRAFT_105046 [Guillardia theta CCMP2712]|uniref:DDE Tnp4 domain-containing protein n=1 Tax=Guillardia theta (strain CCMP2712) TaxID=905079 RepID=L1JKV3_GUITC|nr:hypothetical protein GUITHDRAFT_105046 [Guillardia theta CCMP2712]EKX48962.1 hypothetical protein GUITHDRAFT_105046 [Guillardia theta CCMP2712]|eukprot:XP_005835942.1 hypothetical protein GUITHDRAFT_105046 [Guillardia theta CCMP2712]
MFLDQHYQQTDLPAGHSCGILDRSDSSQPWTPSGLHYFAGVLPNGISLIWGPWKGPMQEMTTLLDAQVCAKLEQSAEEAGVDFCACSQSSNLLSARLYPMNEACATEMETESQRPLDSLMSRFRLLAKDTFGEAVKIWSTLNHRCNMRLGAQKLERAFVVQLLIFNIRSIFSRDQITEEQEKADLFLRISLEDYLSKIRGCHGN